MFTRSTVHCMLNLVTVLVALILTGGQGWGADPEFPSSANSLRGVLRSVAQSCEAGTPPSTPLSPLLVRTTDKPARTSWVPVGERYASLNELTNPVFPEADHYISIHGGVRNPDEISIAFAPVFSASWTAQPQLFVPEGGGFDAAGNVYTTPTFFAGGNPDQTNVIYVIDRATGGLLWAVGRGQVGQGGVPMALGPAGQEVIYGGGYESIYAVRRDGTVLWHTPTGLPPVPDNSTAVSHMYGVSYHQATDSILAEYGSGDILAFDRVTGERWAAYKIDASPAVPATFKLPDAITAAANAEFKATFAFDSDESPMDILLDIALGNNLIIANYYGVDPNSRRLWVAATLKDGHEGDSHPGDGYSEYGALYGIDLARPNGFTVHCAMPFQGGTAATPTVRADGKRVYTADAAGNALAFHTEDCSLVWSVPVGSQIVGSLSVSSVGGEIYASTASSVFKIVERDDSAALVWEARIAEAFHTGRLAEAVEPLIDAVKHYLGVTSPVSVSYTNFNLAATGENGVMIQAAAGVEFRIPPTPPATQPFPLLIPLAMSMTLLDRETGRPVNSTSAVEETFAAITSGPEGATAIGNSPFRRLMARAAIDVALDQAGAGDVARCVADWLVPPLTGGITKYGIAERFDLLARDAACGGSTRLANTLAHVINPVGIAGDIHDAGRLIRQAREATNTAVQRQEINRPRAAALNMQYAAAETALGNNNLDDAQRALARACSLLDTRP